MNNKLDTRQSDIQLVRQRIRIINGMTMPEKLFNKKSKEMATWMVDNFGMEIIDKLEIYTLDERWWPLEYVP